MEKNIAKSNVPKKWYMEIIKLAAVKTKINIEESNKLDDSGLHFVLSNKEDAEYFENNIGRYIIESIKEYMIDKEIDRTLYLMNLLFTSSRENIVVNFYW